MFAVELFDTIYEIVLVFTCMNVEGVGTAKDILYCLKICMALLSN